MEVPALPKLKQNQSSEVQDGSAERWSQPQQEEERRSPKSQRPRDFYTCRSSLNSPRRKELDQEDVNKFLDH